MHMLVDVMVKMTVRKCDGKDDSGRVRTGRV